MVKNTVKPKLLVVGDSFMKTDPAFPGQHWSEMLPDYQVDNRSQDGSSNGIIAERLWSALNTNPDAVVLGFTEPNRIEFDYQDGFVTHAHHNKLKSEQALTADLYKIHTSQRMNMIKSCVMVRGLLLTLEKQKIPYAWTLNLLFNNLATLPYPSDPDVQEILGEFMHRMTATNLATYQGFKMIPGFHTDDPAWQSRFAQEVREILQK
jgi:hypothetical protein